MKIPDLLLSLVSFYLLPKPGTESRSKWTQWGQHMVSITPVLAMSEPEPVTQVTQLGRFLERTQKSFLNTGTSRFARDHRRSACQPLLHLHLPLGLNAISYSRN